MPAQPMKRHMPPAFNAHLLNFVQVGDEIDVWWPEDKVFYSGRITGALLNNRREVTYTDGEKEYLRLEDERWRFTGQAAERVRSLLRSQVS